MSETRFVCSVTGCKNTTENCKTTAIRFFSFPGETDAARRTRWVDFACTGKENKSKWEPSKNEAICSRHFHTGKPNTNPLHTDYVPTIIKPFEEEEGKSDVGRDSKRSSEEPAASTGTIHPIEGSSSMPNLLEPKEAEFCSSSDVGATASESSIISSYPIQGSNVSLSAVQEISQENFIQMSQSCDSLATSASEIASSNDTPISFEPSSSNVSLPVREFSTSGDTLPIRDPSDSNESLPIREPFASNEYQPVREPPASDDSMLYFEPSTYDSESTSSQYPIQGSKPIYTSSMPNLLKVKIPIQGTGSLPVVKEEEEQTIETPLSTSYETLPSNEAEASSSYNTLFSSTHSIQDRAIPIYTSSMPNLSKPKSPIHGTGSLPAIQEIDINKEDDTPPSSPESSTS